MLTMNALKAEMIKIRIALANGAGNEIAHAEIRKITERVFAAIDEESVFVLRAQDRIAAIDEEPVFVLRAQDRIAPMVVTFWAEIADELLSTPYQKIEGAIEVRDRMADWQAANKTKVKDPD